MTRNLLEIVLDEKVREFTISDNTIKVIVLRDIAFVSHNHPPRIEKDCSTELNFNIYELAHKCKEWAVMLQPNKQALSSYPRWGNHTCYSETDGHYYICQHLVTGAQFEAETEPEAIFKACQWLLDNITKDNNEN